MSQNKFMVIQKLTIVENILIVSVSSVHICKQQELVNKQCQTSRTVPQVYMYVNDIKVVKELVKKMFAHSGQHRR